MSHPSVPCHLRRTRSPRPSAHRHRCSSADSTCSTSSRTRSPKGPAARATPRSTPAAGRRQDRHAQRRRRPGSLRRVRRHLRDGDTRLRQPARRPPPPHAAARATPATEQWRMRPSSAPAPACRSRIRDRPKPGLRQLVEAVDVDHPAVRLPRRGRTAVSSASSAQLATVIQHAIRENRPLAFCAAGLPAAINDVLSDRIVTFLRRADRHVLERRACARCRRFVRRGGRRRRPHDRRHAAAAAAAATGGYPFMIQLVGYHAWRQQPDAPRSPSTTSSEVPTPHANVSVDWSSSPRSPTCRRSTGLPACTWRRRRAIDHGRHRRADGCRCQLREPVPAAAHRRRTDRRHPVRLRRSRRPQHARWLRHHTRSPNR